MKVYDENTKEEIQSPNLDEGYVYDGVIVTGQDTKVIQSTVTSERKDGLRKMVNIEEQCKLYHRYTEEELAAIEDRKELPTLNERLAAAEAAILELASILGG